MRLQWAGCQTMWAGGGKPPDRTRVTCGGLRVTWTDRGTWSASACRGRGCVSGCAAVARCAGGHPPGRGHAPDGPRPFCLAMEERGPAARRSCHCSARWICHLSSRSRPLLHAVLLLSSLSAENIGGEGPRQLNVHTHIACTVSKTCAAPAPPCCDNAPPTLFPCALSGRCWELGAHRSQQGCTPSRTMAKSLWQPS